MKIATIVITQTATINFSTNLFNNIVREKNREVTKNVIKTQFVKRYDSKDYTHAYYVFIKLQECDTMYRIFFCIVYIIELDF